MGKVTCEAYTDRGIVGPRGKSAYEQAVEGGYTGTEEEFEAALASDINTVAGSISDVNTVGANISDVQTVAGVSSDVSTVAGISSDVSAVSSNSTNISTVAGIATAVNNVASNESAILNVSDNLVNVNTIASNMNSVLATAGDIANIDAVAGNKTNIDTVAGISSDVSAVAGVASDISEVKDNATNISTVATNISDVNTVATNISNVNYAASNMSAIIAAPTQAANAATSASNAQKWAEGSDADVAPLGGTKSSKGWANRAQEIAESLGAIYKPAGSIAFASLPALSADVLGNVYNITDAFTTTADFVEGAGNNYPAGTNVAIVDVGTGGSHSYKFDVLSGFVDLSAYRTSSVQDLIDAGKADNTNKVNGVPLSTASAYYYGESTSAADAVQKEVSIPSITTLNTGQIIMVKPTITSTVANSTLKLNGFNAYPMLYAGAAITTSTDSKVWAANTPSWFVFDGSNWCFAGYGKDDNTTYTLNYVIFAGTANAGVGNYAVTRYALLMQKLDGTWETLKETSTNYSTGTTKTVNTSGFIPSRITYYGTTTVKKNGEAIGVSSLYLKSASVDARYSFNCGATPGWSAGDSIYVVGTIGTDGLFYLDSTTWWSNALPTTQDGKVYMYIGTYVSDAYKITLDLDHPMFYHDGTSVKSYVVAWNKLDSSEKGAASGVATLDANSKLTSSQVPDLSSTYLPLSGGTMTGDLFIAGANSKLFGFKRTNDNTNIDIGWEWSTNAGAGAEFRSNDFTDASKRGAFIFFAKNSSGTYTQLVGTPAGSLTWGNNEVQTVAHKGIANGIASLDSDAKIKEYQLPVRTTFVGYYETVGSPTLTDGVMTDFSSTAYAKSLSTFKPESNPWVSVTKVKVYSFTNVNTIISGSTAGTKNFQVGIKNGANAGKLCLYVSSDGSATDIANNLMSTNAVISLNTWYWVAAVFTGTKYEVRLSDDNATWTTVISTNSSTPIYQGTKNSYGYNTSAYPEPLDGEIDFNETYIKVLNSYFIPPIGYPILPTDMIGADGVNAGYAGLVPAPAATDNNKFLKGDGTWSNPTAATAWGNITGTLSDQTDLQNALNSCKRNVGEIVESTIPLTDAGLHLLDGALLTSGSYGDFITYMATVYSSHPELFTTEADWQASVSAYGICGKFVYDSVNSTIRLPKKASSERHLIRSSVNGTSWYDIYSDGLCEQGGVRAAISGDQSGTVNLLVEYADTNYEVHDMPLASNKTGNARSGCMLGAKSTDSFVLWQDTYTDEGGNWRARGYVDVSDYGAETVYQYIVIANSTKTEIEVDIDEIATDLNGKADVDLTNVSGTSGFRKLIEVYNNGVSWYKVYAEYNPSTGAFIGNWCEQGGRTVYSTTGTETVALLKEMRDTNYLCQVTLFADTSGYTSGIQGQYLTCWDLTTTSFKHQRFNAQTVQQMWKVEGYLA